MVRVKALRDFSSTVFGAVSAGDVFELDAGYVKDMESWGMIAPMVTKPAVAPAPLSVPEVDPIAARLEAVIAAAPVTVAHAPGRRGRPRRSKKK